MDNDDASMIRTNHSFAFPMAYLCLEVHNGWRALNAHTTWNATAFLIGAFSLSSILPDLA
jgi:hypothetical protein